MKRTAVKRLAVIILTIITAAAMLINASAETIQDRLEQELESLVSGYEGADSETQQSLQERFSSLLASLNLDDMSLESLRESDIAGIISGLGDSSALQQIFGLAQDAWSSGIQMVQDAFGGGNGTSGGENTATTNAPVVQTTNIIITGALPNVSTSPATETTTQEAATYNIGDTTAPGIVGAGVTAGEKMTGVSVEDEGTGAMSAASIVVLVVLSVATIAVIAAIVIFFVLKKK